LKINIYAEINFILESFDSNNSHYTTYSNIINYIYLIRIQTFNSTTALNFSKLHSAEQLLTNNSVKEELTKFLSLNLIFYKKSNDNIYNGVFFG
jgi:hypothetical protein